MMYINVTLRDDLMKSTGVPTVQAKEESKYYEYADADEVHSIKKKKLKLRFRKRSKKQKKNQAKEVSTYEYADTDVVPPMTLKQRFRMLSTVEAKEKSTYEYADTDVVPPMTLKQRFRMLSTVQAKEESTYEYADTDEVPPMTLKKRIRMLSKASKKKQENVAPATLTESNLSVLDRFFAFKQEQPVYPLVAFTENDDDNRTETTVSEASSLFPQDLFALPDLEYCKKAVETPYSALFKTRICAECGQCVHKYLNGGYTKKELIHEHGEIETSLEDGCHVETIGVAKEDGAANTEKIYYHPFCLQRKKDRQIHKENGYADVLRELQEVIMARNEQKSEIEAAKVQASLDCLSLYWLDRRRKARASRSKKYITNGSSKLKSFFRRLSLRQSSYKKLSVVEKPCVDKKPSVAECCKITVNPTHYGQWIRLWYDESTTYSI